MVGTTPVTPTIAAPGVPIAVGPVTFSTGVITSTSLQWSAATDAQQYDVALGITNPPPIICVGLSATSYQPPLVLMANTTYFWQITATGAGGSTAGPVSTFTTAAAVSPTISPSGTTIFAGGQLIDAAGAVWTIAGAAILRNGVHAAGGIGRQILWWSSNIYIFGSDANWYVWDPLGSWKHIGSRRVAPAPARRPRTARRSRPQDK